MVFRRPQTAQPAQINKMDVAQSEQTTEGHEATVPSGRLAELTTRSFWSRCITDMTLRGNRSSRLPQNSVSRLKCTHQAA